MKRLFVILVFLQAFLFSGIAQEKELFILYDYQNQEDGYEHAMELRANNNEVISKICRELECVVHGSDKPFEIVKTYTYVYKDKEMNKFYSKELAVSVDLFVCDEIPDLNWQLSTESKSILGYTCQKANTKFRGREYCAWFTTELPFKAAPWKFSGLPGVVLQVDSSDDFFQLEAKELRIQEAKPIKNPYAKKDKVSWQEFREVYLEKDKAFMEFMKTKAAKLGEEMPKIFKSRIEIIIEENRKSKSQFLKEIELGNESKIK